jgi:general secretion pathway protein I
MTTHGNFLRLMHSVSRGCELVGHGSDCAQSGGLNVSGKRMLAPPRRASRRAFTLIEVLVSLVVFAMVAVVLGASYLNVLNSYEVVSRGMQINEDFAFARQLVLREPDRLKLEQGGEFETAGARRAKWTAEILSTTIPNVFTVNFTCEISDPTRTEPERLVQSFTLLRPTWSTDAAELGKLKTDVKARIYELQGKKPQ